MGGRGSRSGGAPGGGAGGLGGGGLGVGVPNAIPQGPPPNVVPGQPVPAISLAQFQSMSDSQFVAYMNGLQSTPIDPNTYYNSNWDTQRLVANIPELNVAPQVVDQSTFDSMPGRTYFRTVNADGSEDAVSICARTMMSDVTTLGAGVAGAGFYFADTKRNSQAYGSTKGDVYKTATMQVKFNSKAKFTSRDALNSMLNKESRSVYNAVMRQGQNGLMSYALRKGFNVVSVGWGGYVNIIDRGVATWSSDLLTKQ